MEPLTAPAQQDPDWLQAAEDDYTRDLKGELPWGLEAHRRTAEINSLLARLLIEPIEPAYVDSSGYGHPAVLTRYDTDLERWGVDAAHNGREVFLELENWETEYDFRPGPTLRCRADVARARREGAADPRDQELLDAALRDAERQLLDLVSSNLLTSASGASA